MLIGVTVATTVPCRSPYGERGLKSCQQIVQIVIIASLSLRRAWIEMAMVAKASVFHVVALLTESVD